MVNRKRKVCSFTLNDKTIDRIEDIVGGKYSIIPRNITKSELIEILVDRLYTDKEKVLVTQLRELEVQKAIIQDKIDLLSEELNVYLEKKQEADNYFNYGVEIKQ